MAGKLFDILDEIQDKLRMGPRPKTLVDALRVELGRLYTHTALEICKQKLRGVVDRKSLERMKEIRRCFEYAEETEKTFVDCEASMDILDDLYQT